MNAFAPLLTHSDLLAKGYLFTLGISLASVATGLVLALPLVVLKLGGPSITPRLAAGLIDLVRSLPFLILLLLVHFAMPVVLFRVSPWVSGMIALSLYAASYFAEALRAAYLSVPPGQLEAAKALGLQRAFAVRLVVAPQMMAAFTPAGRVIAIMLLKESAVLSIITVPELTHASLRIQAETFETIPTFIAAALLYWSMTLGLAGLAHAMERRFAPFEGASPRHGPVAARFLTLDWPARMPARLHPPKTDR